MLDWISEEVSLPRVGQIVLLATPRQGGEFWDFDVAQMLIRHEGVTPIPVPRGSENWPTAYFWGRRGEARSTSLVTGNGWWASLHSIPLPPMAEHAEERGYTFVRQIGKAFVPKGSDKPERAQPRSAG